MNISGNLIKSKMAIGQIFKNTLEPPSCLAIMYITSFLVFGYVESISDVTFSVQGQDYMLKVR